MIERLTQYRRDLHRIPELGFELPKTRAYVLAALGRLPCETVMIGEAGVCAFFDAGRQDAFAFRSDMDALPISEKNECGYASAHAGKMHACGHDGHMAVMLAFADELSRDLGALPHNVLLVFQAAEETTGGAKEICGSGVFERYRVKRVFGLHLWPGYPKGAIVCRRGEFMAGTRNLQVDVTGRSAHAAKAESGADALMAGVRFVADAYAMESGEMGPSVPRLLKFGVFQSGAAMNIVSSHTLIQGTMRCFSDGVFEFMSGRLKEIAKSLEREFGCSAAITFLEGYPAVVNDGALFEEFKAAVSAGRGFGGAGPCLFIEPEAPTMIAEDFSFYQKQAPGIFFHLGMGSDAPLHSDTFDIDESALPFGVEAFARLLLNIP